MGIIQELQTALNEGFAQRKQEELQRLSVQFKNVQIPTKDCLLARAKKGATRFDICTEISFDPEYIKTTKEVRTCFEAVHGSMLYDELNFRFEFPTKDTCDLYVCW
jgi:hypothetical protein